MEDILRVPATDMMPELIQALEAAGARVQASWHEKYCVTVDRAVLDFEEIPSQIPGIDASILKGRTETLFLGRHSRAHYEDRLQIVESFEAAARLTTAQDRDALVNPE